MQERSVSFPSLRCLTVNELNQSPPRILRKYTEDSNVKEPIAWIRMHIKSISARNHAIRNIRFGSQRWDMGDDGHWWPYPSPETLLWWEDGFGRDKRVEARVIDSKKVAKAMIKAWLRN